MQTAEEHSTSHHNAEENKNEKMIKGGQKNTVKVQCLLT